MVEFETNDIVLKANTTPDLFSPKDLDIGTKLLLETISKLGLDYQAALDWGCGWGAISMWLGKYKPSSTITGLDSDIGAVMVAKQNVVLNALNNVVIVASHGFSQVEKRDFDLIVSNPPTHRGREVVEQMIAQSFERLNNNGSLVIVVEARLKPWVARQMKLVFGDCSIEARNAKHVVLMSTKMV